MSETLAPYHPDQPEETIPPFDLSKIPDEELDRPSLKEILPNTSVSGDQSLDLPPVILGCAPFGYGIYANKDNVLSSMPLRLVRLALRSGITAFDTSPYYHPSEIILGQALKALSPEYPRQSYQIITKAGKYGPKIKDHVYDPEVIRKSVMRSLKRFDTDYLDVVYLHDVEYVSSETSPCPAGMHLEALNPTSTTSPYKLDLTKTQKPLGSGDQSILSSLETLRELQSKGLIRKIGIAGYPLPILLRLSLLILHQTSKPLDIIQTYAHQTLLTSTLSEKYLSALTNLAKVGQVVNAAPLAMGILTSSGGPDWHPARGVFEGRITAATKEAGNLSLRRGVGLEKVAAAFGFREVKQDDGRIVPVVIGCTDLEQVHETLRSWGVVNGDLGGEGGEGRGEERRKLEKIGEEIRDLFEKRGVRGVSWQVPSQKDL